MCRHMACSLLDTRFAHRFCQFIMDLEHVGEVEEADAMEETQLTEEQIQNIAAEFGQHATTAQDLFRMKRQMLHDDFRGWVNAVGYLQMLQNAFAHEIVEKNGCKSHVNRFGIFNVTTQSLCL